MQGRCRAPISNNGGRRQAHPGEGADARRDAALELLLRQGARDTQLLQAVTTQHGSQQQPVRLERQPALRQGALHQEAHMHCSAKKIDRLEMLKCNVAVGMLLQEKNILRSKTLRHMEFAPGSPRHY